VGGWCFVCLVYIVPVQYNNVHGSHGRREDCFLLIFGDAAGSGGGGGGGGWSTEHMIVA